MNIDLFLSIIFSITLIFVIVIAIATLVLFIIEKILLKNESENIDEGKIS